MHQLNIRLFGYPQLLIGETPIKPERRKTLALAAYLAVEAGAGAGNPAAGGIPREEAAALLWPDCSQEQAGAYLRQALWDFNKSAGGEWLAKDDQRLSFDPAASIWVDVNEFRQRSARWKSGGGNGSEGQETLRALAGLYQRDFLAGFTLRGCPDFDGWQSLQAETLRLHLAQALEALSALLAGQGEFEGALYQARRWLSLDPLNEAAHRALMRLYEQQGQPGAALRQFQACRQLLQEELGVEPAEETAAVYRQIRSRAGRPKPAGQAEEPAAQAAPRPSGTVTFLFTDIEGSTQLWEHYPEGMQRAFARQEAIFRQSMAGHGGYVYKMIGDAFQVAFQTAPGALAAALAAQRGLLAEDWDEIGALRVRMALHSGVTEERGDDYVGPDLNRVARVLSAGYGGQVLLNQSTYELVRDHLPPGADLLDLGEHYLKDLVHPEHIYQLAAPGLPEVFPPLKTADPQLINLPAQPTPFIGREEELARIEQLLQTPGCRLITLVGIGGAGKTRLAIQAAATTRSFAHGVYFVPLAAVTGEEGMVQAIADAVKFHFAIPAQGSLPVGEAQAQLAQYLAGKHMLLVLDNFEQLTACADDLAALLDACPQVQILVTSRERLNLRGEWALEVGGLSFPGNPHSELVPQFDAVQLFVKGADRACGFTPGPDDWPAIARICQLLEGMPLGVEMAAAWVKMLSCQEICSEIERDLDFLTASWRGMPERHRTLRAVFEHSWRLLSDQERYSLGRLSVFVRGFSREAALEVAGAPLAVLTSLADKSLLRRLSAGRFTIHPLLQQYAAARLAASPEEREDALRRRTAYYADWLSRMYQMLRGPDQLAALIMLRTEAANVRAVWQQMVADCDYARLSRAMPALILFYIMNDRRVETAEVVQILRDLVDQLRPGRQLPGLLAFALAALRAMSFNLVGFQTAGELQNECLEALRLAPDGPDKAYALLLVLMFGGSLGWPQVRALADEAVRSFGQQGDGWCVAMVRLVLADSALFGGFDPELAREMYLSSQEFFRRAGSDWGRAVCLTGLFHYEHKAGNLEAAFRLGKECVEILSSFGNQERLLWLQHEMGNIAETLGDLPAARGYYSDILAYAVRMGNLTQQAFYQEQIARLDAAPAV